MGNRLVNLGELIIFLSSVINIKMFIEKLYRGLQISDEDLIQMVAIYFKILKIQVTKQRVVKFVDYMLSFNDIPLMDRFMSINEIIVNILPVIEKEIDLTKVMKGNQLIKIQYDKQKLINLQSNL